MATNSNFGSHYTGDKWTPQIEISGPNVGTCPPIEYMVDEFLLANFIDPYNQQGPVTLPAGRFTAAGSAVANFSGAQTMGVEAAGKTRLTLHDGKNLKPNGMSINNIFREAGDFMADGMAPRVRRGFVAEVPFIVTPNEDYGVLKSGDRLTGHYGSTSSLTVINFKHRGKPVKWLAKKAYAQTGSAGASHVLAAATLPGVAPRVVAAYASGVMINPTSALTWNGSAWVAGFTGTGSGTVDEILYEYGQDEDQIAGELAEIRSISNMNADDYFFKWVEFGDNLNFPPATKRREVTLVSAETPTTVTAGIEYRAANVPISLHHPVVVEIKGTVIDDDGNSTTYTSEWFTLPTDVVTDMRKYFIGRWHSVDWTTGSIKIGANITVTAIQITYYYENDPQNATLIWGGCIEGLTDGANLTAGTTYSGTTVVPAKPYGTAAHLNLTGVVGSLKVFVH